MQRNIRITTAALMATLLLPMSAMADLDNPSSSAGGSAMPTTTDIYNRLATGAAITIPGAFQGPPAGAIVGTRKTLAEIQTVLPVQNAANAALASDVLETKTFWGLGAGGAWGLQTGSIPVRSSFSGGNGLLTFPIPDGYYGSKTSTAVDSNLVSGNIKSGTSIFGITGSFIGPGTAIESNVLAGATFSNGTADGLTGTMVNNGAVTITTPNTTLKTIGKGYHNGSGTIPGDANLVAANIKQGVNLFGVAGSYFGKYTCSGTSYGTISRWCDNGDGTVRDMLTGLLWLRDANCLALQGQEEGRLAWADASIWSSALANGSCGLTDGSIEGMWRLPTRDELFAITVDPNKIKFMAPPLAFVGIRFDRYWSSSSYADGTSEAWNAVMGDDGVFTESKDIKRSVWPVRAGH